MQAKRYLLHIYSIMCVVNLPDLIHEINLQTLLKLWQLTAGTINLDTQDRAPGQNLVLHLPVPAISDPDGSTKPSKYSGARLAKL